MYEAFGKKNFTKAQKVAVILVKMQQFTLRISIFRLRIKQRARQFTTFST
jgi:hypothetical protein